jgi:aminobenzoyl-glutamate transport protein
VSKEKKEIAIEKKSGFMKFLDFVERVGNKLPHPFTLFVILMVVIMIISWVVSAAGISVIHPTTAEVVYSKNLLSGEGVIWMMSNMIKNFTGFAPLGLVLTMTLGIGLAEKVGFMSSFMRRFMLSAPERVLLLVVFFIGIVGNIASDAAVIIIPPLAGALFYSTKRNPIVGIAAGYAATCAGFTANVLIAGTDALLAGITQEAAQGVLPGVLVSPAVNYYFMIVSTLLLTFVGAWVTKRFVEPQVGKFTPNEDLVMDESFEVTEKEKKGLKFAGLFTLAYLALILVILLPAGSIFRGPEGTLVPSPFLSNIVPFLLLWFIGLSIAYGVAAGTIKSESDIPKHMTSAIRDMSGYIVLVFVIAQFVQYFNWTNIGLILAVNLASILENLNMTGLPMVLGIVIISAFVNLFIGSGSAKWALLSPVFVPMFILLGYAPEYSQLAYRLGDSFTNAITPLFPYFPILLGFVAKYDKDKAKIGTIMAIMMPYTIAFGVVWLIQLSIWHLLNLPLGPGGFIYL